MYISTQSFPLLSLLLTRQANRACKPQLLQRRWAIMSALESAEGGGAGRHMPTRAAQAQSASDDDDVLFVGEYAPVGVASRSRCVSRGAHCL